MDPLAVMPGLAELASNLDTLASEGIHGGVDLGPVHLEVASSVLVIAPPTFPAGPADPVVDRSVRRRPDRRVATVAARRRQRLPGGGSLVRLPRQRVRRHAGTAARPRAGLRDGGRCGDRWRAVVPRHHGRGVPAADSTVVRLLARSRRRPRRRQPSRRHGGAAFGAAHRNGGRRLFAIRPPANALALVTAADRLFPFNRGTHLVGPSLKLSWLSFGPEGSLIGLDLAVIVELPTGKVVILGVARASIPGLPFILNLRLDVLGIIDPVEQLASVDASLVDSHVLGVFEVYGDAAMRLSWGPAGYMLATVGGFYPGFNPEPARLPALRRVGMAMDNPLPIIEVRAEGYFAVTSNSIQLGGRWEIGIALGIEAHGFVQVDAIVQFRPFHFDARIAAGFDVSVDDFSFASVTLEGSVGGPGPIVIHGSLSIDVFLFSISWSETFTLGSGPSDTLPAAPLLIDVIAEELKKPENVHSGSIADPLVVLAPRPRAERVCRGAADRHAAGAATARAARLHHRACRRPAARQSARRDDHRRHD